MTQMKLKNFRECSIEKFNEALLAVRINTISNIATDLLYIAYTKYCSDSLNVGLAASNAYHTSVLTKIEKVKENLLKELNRRGYSKEGYRYD